MKIVQSFVFLLITYLESNLACAQGIYAPSHHTNDIDESVQDRSFVKLGHSNPVYDNVGMLYCSNVVDRDPKDSDFGFLASTVYIGDRICLTSAHCSTDVFFKGTKNWAVCFEIGGKRTPFYHAVEFITHPNYETNIRFDIAALVLREPVDGLTGLKPYYGFSEKKNHYNDNEHLLTYVHYGMKLLYNDWFVFTDYQRRAMQAHTKAWMTDPRDSGIFSTPYGNSNDYKHKRTLIPYEAKRRAQMSGGACIHPDFGVVSIISGGAYPEYTETFSVLIYLFLASKVNIVLYSIKDFLFPMTLFNTSITNNFTEIYSVPLGAVKDWLEGIEMQSSV